MFRFTSRALVMLLILTWSLAGCGGSPSGAPVVNDTPTQLPATAYRVGSGDRIKLVVFRHEDLSGEFALDGSGNFAMPLVGEIEAGGLTTREVEIAVVNKLKDGFLVDPQVSVEVLNYRPFYILGEVKSPGSYSFVNGMTVLNAVALAGGFSYRAKQSGVVVRRGGANAPGVVVTGDTAILPGDVLEVPERLF